MEQVQIPVRETSRLKLVPLTESFSEGIYELFSHSEVCRYCSKAIDKYGNRIDLPVTTRSESDKIIDFFLDYSERGEGFRWAVITKEDEEFVGAVGFNSLGKVSELAYHQLPSYWGNGLMSEACTCALEWIRGKFGCEYVVAFIESGNESSVRLAMRLGFLSSHEEREGAERYQLDLSQPFQPVAGGDATRWRS